MRRKLKIIHIEIDPAEVDKSITVDLPLIGDAKEILGKILAAVEAAKRKNGRRKLPKCAPLGGCTQPTTAGN